MTKKDLAKIEKVYLEDFSDYDLEKCNNGGCYSFTTLFSKTKSDKYEISYDTSAEFSYCPACGTFGDHYNSDTDKYECGGFEEISSEELMKRIDQFKNDCKDHNEKCEESWNDNKDILSIRCY